ncbi:response regulator [Mesoterricola silvestris]|uniref:Transcriptional regulatory protein n=1 Tax=Mesoterricola silvestris TaxID=2927979 RepID=A0AA48GIX6_9BACT|nr:response regulator [Mesoterricola silvestris]BDU71919.1 two-component system response regulator DcuR [Mesoterricola silvestris]
MIQVLLVEDDPMVAEVNRLYVDRVPGFCAAASARDGAAALELLRTRPFDLVLLDIGMPGPDGLDLLATIRASDLEVDVIFVTAARDTRTIGRALKLGAMDYLIKPFEFERMKQALEHYAQAHRMMSQDRPASQEDLDRVFARPAAHPDLPKGLDRSTLGSVWKALAPGAPGITCEELGQRVGLSRVSVRKYLEFLTTIQALRRESAFGAIGRPLHLYHLQAGAEEAVRPFL